MASQTNGKLPTFGLSEPIKHQMGGIDGLPAKLNVWSVFSPLAGYVPSDAINLGQGFMSFGPPQFVLDGVTESLKHPDQQHYSLPMGRIRLRKAISDSYSEEFGLGRPIDPNSEVIISAGANFAMSLATTCFLRPDDEVLCIEPFFDHFVYGKPVFVAMHPPPNAGKGVTSAADWKLDVNDLRAAVTPKTRAIILNTPHNPVGKVFTRDELTEIAHFCEEANLLVIADEVYDCLTFGDAKHVRFASLPGMWNRTITIGSAGKSFACTGWRIGWAIGPKQLIGPLSAATSGITFCTNSPMQEGVAHALEASRSNGFFDTQRREYEERRDVMCSYLDQIGVPYSLPQGSYFILVNVSQLRIPEDFEILDMLKEKTFDWHAAWFCAKEAGVVVIPPTDFYSADHQHIGADFVRVAFCKDLGILHEAGKRLLKLKPYFR